MDQGTKTISRVNFEGRHRKTVVESNGYLDQPFGLAVFEVRQHYNTVAHQKTTVFRKPQAILRSDCHIKYRRSLKWYRNNETMVCCRGLCTGAKQWHGPSAEPINTTGGTSRYCCQMPIHQEGCSSCTPPFSHQVHWIGHICSLTLTQLSVRSPDGHLFGHLFGPQGRLRAATRGGCVSTSASSTSCPTVQSSGVFLQKPD